ncbi:MAG: nuclease [Akkermansiaceae bacterium]
MPIEHAIWTVGETPTSLSTTKLSSEQVLEEMIDKEPSILSNEWMLIGRQAITSSGGRIDLLAIAPDASLVLIELKRDKTPRDIVAQALDYATWVETLSTDKISQIYHKYSNGGSLDDDFEKHFGSELDEEALNQSHQIILCASELDAATERIVGYLNNKDIPINVLFFQVFQHGDTQLLSRTWLLDPSQTQENVALTAKSKGTHEPWNGEYYGSFGDALGRSWAEAQKYGFFSAGGGSWYSQTLSMLSPGDRIWVRIPKLGYVGVGIVESHAQRADQYIINTPEGEKPCLDVLKESHYHRDMASSSEEAEYFVDVKWLNTLPKEQAFHEVGFFGQQNSVCRPSTPKWRHTVDRLKVQFPNWDR